MHFVVAHGNILPFEDNSFEKVIIVLALQNIKDIGGTIKECSRVLRDRGTLIIILNHPAFRIPKYSSWGLDEEKAIHYRRVDAYMSESEAEIAMHPREEGGEKTLSFHRPLQVYGKVLTKNNLVITGIEEWISHKTSKEGPHSLMENKARKEFSLFLALKAQKLSLA